MHLQVHRWLLPLTCARSPLYPTPQGQYRQAQQDWAGEAEYCLQELAPGREGDLGICERQGGAECVQQACPVSVWLGWVDEADEVEGDRKDCSDAG